MLTQDRKTQLAELQTGQIKATSSHASRQARVSRPMRAAHWIAFAAVVCVAAFLNLFRLQQNGYGNTYYTIAVRSMSLNWHTFFFASFDPAGFVSVDKPPLGLWIQVLSVKLFGFSSLSLLIPQALEGVMAVALLFYLVRRSSGTLAGALSALALAITPVWVAMSRANNLDITLILILLLATWAVTRAVETARLRWLLLGMALVGLGFNVKMLQAYLVLPALLLFYLLFVRLTWKRRLLYLTCALAPLLLISFAWITAVDLTPASQRPYVGSSQTNSELELAIGYNGLGRLMQMSKEPPEKHAPPIGSSNASRALAQMGALLTSQAFQAKPPVKKTPATPATGYPGISRLFIDRLGAQASWLLLFALLGLPVLAWQRSWRKAQGEEVQVLALWGIWLLVTWLVLSFSVHIQTYYTTMLAPPISALTGVALALLWRDYMRHPARDWRGWMLPPFLVLAVVFQLTLLNNYPGWSNWLSPALLTLAILSALALVGARLLRISVRLRSSIARAALACSLIALLFAPFTWSAVELTYPANGGFPLAGPPAATLQGTLSRFQQTLAQTSKGYTLSQENQRLLEYLLARRGNTPYLLATSSTYVATPFLLATNQPVMALGGYNGTDPILSLSRLTNLIEQGQVRFFWLPFSVRALAHRQFQWSGQGGPNSVLEKWVASHCELVPTLSHRPPAHFEGQQVVYRFYDCASIQAHQLP